MNGHRVISDSERDKRNPETNERTEWIRYMSANECECHDVSEIRYRS